jgi:hypothetical protein
MASKKRQAMWIVLQQASVSGGIAAMPTPGLEVGKHALLLSVNEIAMCVRIATVYAGRKVSEEDVKQLLIDGGVAFATGGGLAFLATQAGRGILNEILNFIPIIGWGIKALIAGSLTAIVGATFIGIADSYWGEGDNNKTV